MSKTPVISALWLVAAASQAAQQQPATPVTVAQPTAASEAVPVRVATIFGQNALASTQEGQKASQALNTRFAPQQQGYERKQAELQSLRDQLKKGQATMSPEALASLNRDIDAKNKEVQRLGEDTQAALRQEEGALMQELGDKLMRVIQDYAAHHSLAIVIDVSVPNGPVLWASPSVDITNEIVRLYDQAHPVSAPSPSAPPSKK